MRLAVFGLALMAATPVLAQTMDAKPAPIREPAPPSVTTPGQPPEAVFQGGGPGLANGGPATTGTLARSGTGADNVSNDTAATTNSPTTSQAIPNVGGGGGGGDGGQ